VVDVLGGGEQVRVAAGPLKLTVSAGELRAALRPETPPARPSARAIGQAHAESGRGPAAPAMDPPARDNTCDLRGLRVEDAVAMATTFLDRALSDGRHSVFLLHGHGTGALRDAIRKELARSAYVARFASGEPDQGGEGVTVVWLA
jgi:DNA mismatch repair protein MutS2